MDLLPVVWSFSERKKKQGLSFRFTGKIFFVRFCWHRHQNQTKYCVLLLVNRFSKQTRDAYIARGSDLKCLRHQNHQNSVIFFEANSSLLNGYVFMKTKLKWPFKCSFIHKRPFYPVRYTFLQQLLVFVFKSILKVILDFNVDSPPMICMFSSNSHQIFARRWHYKHHFSKIEFENRLIKVLNLTKMTLKS